MVAVFRATMLSRRFAVLRPAMLNVGEMCFVGLLLALAASSSRRNLNCTGIRRHSGSKEQVIIASNEAARSFCCWTVGGYIFWYVPDSSQRVSTPGPLKVSDPAILNGQQVCRSPHAWKARNKVTAHTIPRISTAAIIHGHRVRHGARGNRWGTSRSHTRSHYWESSVDIERCDCVA